MTSPNKRVYPQQLQFFRNCLHLLPTKIPFSLDLLLFFSQFPLCLLWSLAGTVYERAVLWWPKASVCRDCPPQACCQVRMKSIWLPSEPLTVTGWIIHTAVGADKGFGTACVCRPYFVEHSKNLILLESSAPFSNQVEIGQQVQELLGGRSHLCTNAHPQVCKSFVS